MAGRKKLNVGIVGYGFMGRTHSNAFGKVNQFFDVGYEPVLKAVCGRDKEKIQSFARTWNYETFETDWRKLVERRDIDIVDIAAPNDTHAEIAIAAAAAKDLAVPSPCRYSNVCTRTRRFFPASQLSPDLGKLPSVATAPPAWAPVNWFPAIFSKHWV